MGAGGGERFGVSNFQTTSITKVYCSTLSTLQEGGGGGGGGGGEVWGVKLSDKHYEGVLFNVINVTRGRGWVGIKFPEKSVT